MSSTIWDTIVASTTSGNQLADLLNNFKDAVVSGLSGTSRPTNLQSGGYWIDITNDGLGYWSYKMYNGTADIEIFQINKATGGLIMGSSEEAVTIVKSSDDAFGPKLVLEKQRTTGTQTLVSDVLGDIEFTGVDGSAVEYVQAKISSVSKNNVTAAAQGANIIFYVTAESGTALLEAVRITDTGRLGIGTDTPEKRLHVRGTTTAAGIKATMVADNANGVDLVASKSRVANSGQILASDVLGAHRFESTDNTASVFEAAKLEVSATENHLAGARGSKVTIDNIVTGETTLSNAISIEDDVTIDRKLIVTGDLEVQGTTTSIDSATLNIEDANIVINKGGTQATADAQDSGFTVEMSDATDCSIGYDSTLTSKFKAGEVGSESEIIVSTGAQDLTGKAIIDPSRSDVKKDTEANLITYAALGTTTAGQICFATDTLNTYVIYDNTLQSIGGGGQGGINYIENWNAEKGLDDWSVTGTIPLTLELVNPLFDKQSFKIASAGGADYSGDVVQVTSKTMDNAVKYNILVGEFWFRNADLADGDIIVKVYDIDNAEYVTLNYGKDIPASALDTSHKFAFQAKDGVNYRVEFEVLVATGSYDFIWDNINLSLQAPAVVGAFIGAWEDITAYANINLLPTGGGSLVGSYAYFKTKIIDDTQFVSFRYLSTVAGSGTSPLIFPTPSAHNYDFNGSVYTYGITHINPVTNGFAVSGISPGGDGFRITNLGSGSIILGGAMNGAGLVYGDYYYKASGLSSNMVLSDGTAGVGDIGEVKMFTSATLPADFFACEGQAKSRTQYKELFDVIGTTFGVGDGSTTFNLPDLKDEFIRGAHASRAVGLTEADATAANGLSTISNGNHSHTTSIKLAGLATGIYQGHYVNGTANSYTSSSAGAHTHTLTGDAETRPQNVALQYAIRWRRTISVQTVAQVPSVYFFGAGNGGATVGSGNSPLPFISVKDSHDNWTGYEYMVTVGGDYSISGIVNRAITASDYLWLVVNGVQKYLASEINTSTITQFNATAPLNKGDVVSIRYNNYGVTLIGSASTHYISIVRLK